MIRNSALIIFLNVFVTSTLAEPPSSDNGEQRLTAQLINHFNFNDIHNYGNEPISPPQFPEVNLSEQKSEESFLNNFKVTTHASNGTSTNGKTIINPSRTEAFNEVPEILFSDVPQHRKVLELLLQDIQRGNHLLLVENRGLENKKIAERLLQHLNRPTEYTQLHPTTTIESLTEKPTVKNGTVIYEDSPLVRAAKYGYLLVIDEADRAPTNVTSTLKTFMENGDMVLSDGRRMISKEIMNSSGGKLTGFIPVHEDFRMIFIASQTGFPFLEKDSTILASRNGVLGITAKAVGSSPVVTTVIMGGHGTGPYTATAVASGTAVATATALTYGRGSSTATATAHGSSRATAIAHSHDAGRATATVTTSGSTVGDASADAYNTGGATATVTCTDTSVASATARAQDSAVATATATTSASASLNIRSIARGNEVITNTKTRP